MTTTQTVSNPFALMMDPESVLAAVARSERLARLTSRICRPLDKATVVRDPNQTPEIDRFAEGDVDHFDSPSSLS
jgi:hypothetical protein